jgi:hypothetical protein
MSYYKSYRESHHITKTQINNMTKINQIVLEEEWEADDIISWCRSNGITCQVVPRQLIESLNPSCLTYYFCSTEIVQRIFSSHTAYATTSTYPEQFTPFYGRTINRCMINELQESQLPLFIKPTTNDKLFDGMVIRSIGQLTDLISDNQLAGQSIYASNVVKFLAEYRLFIGNKQLYAMGKHFVEHRGSDQYTLDDAFINQLVNVSADYYAVDIGWAQNIVWTVVEVNPPHSLDDCGIDLNQYMLFSMHAQDWIREMK